MSSKSQVPKIAQINLGKHFNLARVSKIYPASYSLSVIVFLVYPGNTARETLVHHSSPFTHSSGAI